MTVPATAQMPARMCARAAQIEQMSTDHLSECVLRFTQVKEGKTSNSTDSTDIYGLPLRFASLGGVFPGGVFSGAFLGAHMGKSVLSVLIARAANAGQHPAVAPQAPLTHLSA